MLTTMVTQNSVRPISTSAEAFRVPGLASLYLFASTLAMVLAGLNRDQSMPDGCLVRSGVPLPITIVTAIVSPRARPRPRMTAPMMPDLA